MKYCAAQSSKSYYRTWKESYVYRWLNAYNTEHSINKDDYVGKIGFLGCLPEDFVEAMNVTTHGNEESTEEETESTLVASKVFLPGTTNMSAKNGVYSRSSVMTISATAGDGENTVWEYWQNRMNTLQEFYTTEQARISYNIKDYPKNNVTNITLPNKVLVSTTVTSYYYSCVQFSNNGMYSNIGGDLNYSWNTFLPACVVG